MTKEEFLHRVGQILDGKKIEDLSNDELDMFSGVAQYASDIMLNERERRGLITFVSGYPVIEFAVPEGVPNVETILTRDGEAFTGGLN